MGLEGGLGIAILVLGSLGGSSWVEGGFGLAGGLGIAVLVLGLLWGELGGGWIRVGGWIGISSVGAGVSWWE